MPEPTEVVPAAVIADRKIAAYLLNVDHAEGGPKASYFLARGFSVKEPTPFIEALLEHGEPQNLVSTMRSEFGVKYVCEGPLRTPDGANPRVRSVWQKRPDDLWRFLVTAYPF